jgi:hypothetical protein
MHFGGSPFIRGIDGRQIDPATNRPFELGSPYAAKNYFAVMPLMASGFTPGSSPAANDTPQGRVAAPRTIYRRDARMLTLSANGQNHGIVWGQPRSTATPTNTWSTASFPHTTHPTSIPARAWRAREAAPPVAAGRVQIQ